LLDCLLRLARIIGRLDEPLDGCCGGSKELDIQLFLDLVPVVTVNVNYNSLQFHSMQLMVHWMFYVEDVDATSSPGGLMPG
jgi:hypothetical protein